MLFMPTYQGLTRLSLALAFSCFIAYTGFAQGTKADQPTSTATKKGPEGVKLEGRAVLNALTFEKGPTSGQYLGASLINGQAMPFTNKQPVQGFSGVVKNSDGTYMAMMDNGFGTIENSADSRLRVYKIKPNFKTSQGGSGKIDVLGFFELRDPDHHIPFTITHFFTKERLLTGADFDIESVQRAKDGTYWFGDEFGPFLLHTDATGKLLQAPISLPDFDHPGQDVRIPQNPLNEEATPLRIMNALRAHAQQSGNRRTPVCSPAFGIVEDDDPNTFEESRKTPPSGSGLEEASSEIFDVASLQMAGFPVVVWTVNDLATMNGFIKQKVNGIISDRPDLLWQAASTYDGNSDGKPDFLDADGLLNIQLFDAQGHRGGRSLRPENTLPAMEISLDYLMTTLEMDCGITKDGIPVLDHDPHLESAKVRKVDGTSYVYAHEVLIKDYTLRQIQTTFIADKLLAGRQEQKNDLALSPVAVAFAKAKGLPHPYTMPALQQVFDFVKFYAAYYKNGAGKSHLEATKRWKNAERVRFNIETKTNPRTDKDDRGITFADRTLAPVPFAKAVANVIVANGLQERADMQSFDFRTLLSVQSQYPKIRTVYLFGDFPKIGNTGDGANLQGQNGKNSPWLGGLHWPYRITSLQNPLRAQPSGGFEGMGITPAGDKLLPLLEKSLAGQSANTLLIHEFDLKTNQYTGVRYQYVLDARGTAIGDFALFSANEGLVIERDDSKGDLNGFKSIFKIKFNAEGKPVSKELLVNLLSIQDPNKLSEPYLKGDIGLGEHFAFPFITIEDIVILDPTHIGVLNDNNYPFGVGRHIGSQQPEDNEFIILKLPSPL